MSARRYGLKLGVSSMTMLRPADDASLQFVRTLIIIECGQKKMDWQAHNYFVIFYVVTRFTIDSQTILRTVNGYKIPKYLHTRRLFDFTKGNSLQRDCRNSQF